MEDESRNSVLCQVQAVEMSDQANEINPKVTHHWGFFVVFICLDFCLFLNHLNPGEKNGDKQKGKKARKKIQHCIAEEVYGKSSE